MNSEPIQPWHSGDWRDTPNSSPPFNGIEMTTTPTYDNKGKLASVTLVFTDFTKVKEGAKSNDIEISPVKDRAGQTIEPKGNFTIDGRVETRFFPGAPDNATIYFKDISYGLATLRHHVSGGTVEVPVTGKPPVDKLDDSNASATQTNKDIEGTQPESSGGDAPSNEPAKTGTVSDESSTQEGKNDENTQADNADDKA